jgi:uncharacterized membrane protein YhaH (DUF805 family)
MEWMLLPFKRYADFSGRSRRMEYWMFQLFNVIVIAVLAAFIIAGLPSGVFSDTAGLEAEALAEAMQPGVLLWVGFVLVGVWVLASFIPGLAVIVRRLHDRDLSGWWYLGLVLVQLIPIVGWIASLAFFVVTVLPGTDGPNRFGPDPKDPSQAGVFA